MTSIAIVQPQMLAGGDVGARVDAAVAAVHQAAASGARIVLFPEGYPGPLRVGEQHDASEALAGAAGESGCAVCWSRIEPSEGDGFELVLHLHDEHGREAARYVRSHPATGDVHEVLSGTAIAPGPDPPPTVELAGTAVGVLVCSELWLPEVARLLALRGAELILAPAGGGFGRVAENWRLIARARAIENQCFVAMTHARFDGEPGSGIVAGPEAIAADGAGRELTVAELDLGRVRWLREHDDSMAKPKPFSSLPGLLRARRPELYNELVSPREGLYDYWAAAQGARA